MKKKFNEMFAVRCPHCHQIIFKSNNQSPCRTCEVGWSEYKQDEDGNIIIRHCGDACEMLKSYLERIHENGRKSKRQR